MYYSRRRCECQKENIRLFTYRVYTHTCKVMSLILHYPEFVRVAVNTSLPLEVTNGNKTIRFSVGKDG